MDARSQKSALQQLKQFAERDVHSIVVEGPEGSGKTFVAKEFARFVNISDFVTVSPKVAELKQMMNTCIDLGTPVVLCIENLDSGVLGASYSLLKFLEEPLPFVYVIVTCRNVENIPDTIISRCPVATVATPHISDLETYAKTRNVSAYNNISNLPIWKCARTFKDVDTILGFKDDQLLYFQTLPTVLNFRDSVSNLMWKLGHFDDNSEAPTILAIRYLVEISESLHVKAAGIQCISELSKSRIAAHAIIAKFIFECKYCE